MKYDKFGQTVCTVEDLCELLYKNPNVDITKYPVIDGDDIHQYNQSIMETYSNFGNLKYYNPHEGSVEDFDTSIQSTWNMPIEYKKLDIAQWLLDKCVTQEELQRVGQELLLYQERNLFDLLKQIKYMVDTWRANGIVWGVGRGSSVASYVLYLIGIHRINSIYYELDVQEFLR